MENAQISNITAKSVTPFNDLKIYEAVYILSL